jgi:hypothetical protein
MLSRRSTLFSIALVLIAGCLMLFLGGLYVGIKQVQEQAEIDAIPFHIITLQNLAEKHRKNWAFANWPIR